MSESENILSKHTLEDIDSWLKRYPADKKKSAVLAALRAAQHQNNGFLTTGLMDAVAEYLELSKIEVYEVASFYSMYELNPVARHNVAVCTNVCCMLMGSDTIVDHLEKKLDIKLGESTADGRIYLKKEEECLAACAGGPMMQVNHKYYTDLTPEKVDEIIDGLE
ncbi:MAG: NADH-quinone oxidoreductase subunit NuoE [Gammaproteobacteria bacterium]|nr:NADH-quinone oxidoreductase subunit NuoE [Gammaproteobacteria bacterium]MCW8910335.1 NADH-quinone oxidoreductase subunit NuoE [Gammaproteobacteria bacterium]MCW9004783.1 NADH-quinone oxidoreductase subunit NuoE [Gammaproteobacteria bacterium]